MQTHYYIVKFFEDEKLLKQRQKTVVFNDFTEIQRLFNNETTRITIERVENGENQCK